MGPRVGTAALALPGLSQYSGLPLKRLRKDGMTTLAATHEQLGPSEACFIATFVRASHALRKVSSRKAPPRALCLRSSLPAYV